MDLGFWREFVTFSQYMNISEAAKHLHISQPTLSNHLAALERELGTKLFTRDRVLRLTPAGRLLVKHGAEVLEAFDKTVDIIRKAPAEDYTLTIFSNEGPNCGYDSFRLLTNQFLSTKPYFTFVSVNSFEKSVFGVLQDPAIDCGIVYLVPLASDLEAGIAYQRIPALFPNRLGLWMSDRHPLAGRTSLAWDDLNGLTFPMSTLLVPLWTESVHQILRNHGITYDYRVLTGPSLSALADFRGDEALLLDEYAAKSTNYQTIPGHVWVPIDEPDALSETYLAYRPGKISEALQIFLDFIRDQR